MVKTNFFKNLTYLAPSVEVVEMTNEKGFAVSDPITWGDEEDF